MVASPILGPAPLTDAVALAEWNRQARMILGLEAGPTALQVAERLWAQREPHHEPAGTVDSFARRQERIRSGEALPQRPAAPTPAEAMKLTTTHTERRVRRAMVKGPPPIPGPGGEDVGGPWFRELFSAAGYTLSAVADAVPLSRDNMHWIIRGAVGPHTNERRAAILATVRRLAPGLYRDSEWTYLAGRIRAIATVHCRLCRAEVASASGYARPLCDGCRESQSPAEYQWVCRGCGESFSTATGVSGARRRTKCDDCQQQRRLERSRSRYARVRVAPSSISDAERQAIHRAARVASTNRWRSKNRERYLAYERARSRAKKGSRDG